MGWRDALVQKKLVQKKRAQSKFVQYKALLMKDVRQELRTREMLTSMVVYALLVLTIYGAALAQVGDTLQVVSFAGGPAVGAHNLHQPAGA